jgi:hypothetical protein
MERTIEQLGYLSVSDAFTILRAGIPVYIASAPEPSGGLPLRKGWKDYNGDLHFDLSCVYLSKDTALKVARAFGQVSIFAIAPNPEAQGRVYLLQDTVRNRVLSLRYAGIYIADGTHLMTAVADGELPFEPVGEAHPLPADIAFPPSDTHTHAHRGAQARARAVPSRAPAIPKTRISDSAKAGTGEA